MFLYPQILNLCTGTPTADSPYWMLRIWPRGCSWPTRHLWVLVNYYITFIIRLNENIWESGINEIDLNTREVLYMWNVSYQTTFLKYYHFFVSILHSFYLVQFLMHRKSIENLFCLVFLKLDKYSLALD